MEHLIARLFLHELKSMVGTTKKSIPTDIHGKLIVREFGVIVMPRLYHQ